MGSGDQVQILYNASDFRALYRACRRCKQFAVRLLIFAPVLLGYLSYTNGARGSALMLDLLSWLLIGLMVVVGCYWLLPLNAIRIRRKGGWADPMRVELSEQGISTLHTAQDSLFHWNAIQDVIVSKRRIFLFTSPGCAIMLPRRCFANESQFNGWADRARRLWQASKSVTVE